MAISRTSLFLGILVALFLLSNFRSLQVNEKYAQTMIDALEAEKAALVNATLTTNRTLFEPPVVVEHRRKIEQLGDVQHLGRYYQNVTGLYRGPWETINVTDGQNSSAWNSTRRGQFNFNLNGTASLTLESIPIPSADNFTYVEGALSLSREDARDGSVVFRLEGLHHRANGSMLLHGVAGGHNMSLASLLKLADTGAAFFEMRPAIELVYEMKVQEMTRIRDAGGLERPGVVVDDPEANITDCDIQLYVQMRPISLDLDMDRVREYERELVAPTGIPLMNPRPDLNISFFAFSPECGIALSVMDLPGHKTEMLYRKALNFATLATVLAFVQVYLQIAQMEYTQTPSVAAWSITLLTVIDGYLCLVYLTVGISIDDIFMPFASAAFFLFVLISVFELRYLRLTWSVQGPNLTANQELSYLYTRIYGLMMLGVLSYWASGFLPPEAQEMVIAIVAFILYSFWLPQIWRNLVRGSHKSLKRKYVLGMSLTRLFVPLYIYGCPTNVLFVKLESWVYYLGGYVLIQAALLLAQDTFGPRFFVPARFLPEVYNYHPAIPVPDLDMTTPGDVDPVTTLDVEIGPAAAPRRPISYDCSICMAPVEVASSNGLVLSRGQYMVTPCHHLFHTECLEQWLSIKLECPVCRTSLPPA